MDHLYLTSDFAPHRAGYEGDGVTRCTLNPCLDQGACGINAECTNRNGRADCRCNEGYEGDPYRRYIINKLEDMDSSLS